MIIESIKCNTPFFMIIELCKTCNLKTERYEEEVEYETYYPKKTLNGYRCDMYEKKD